MNIIKNFATKIKCDLEFNTHLKNNGLKFKFYYSNDDVRIFRGIFEGSDVILFDADIKNKEGLFITDPKNNKYFVKHINTSKKEYQFQNKDGEMFSKFLDEVIISDEPIVKTSVNYIDNSKNYAIKTKKSQLWCKNPKQDNVIDVKPKINFHI